MPKNRRVTFGPNEAKLIHASKSQNSLPRGAVRNGLLTRSVGGEGELFERRHQPFGNHGQPPSEASEVRFMHAVAKSARELANQ